MLPIILQCLSLLFMIACNPKREENKAAATLPNRTTKAPRGGNAERRTDLHEAALQEENKATATLPNRTTKAPRGGNAERRTDLHEAALQGDTTLVKELLEKRADVNAIDKKKNPLVLGSLEGPPKGGRIAFKSRCRERFKR